MKNIILAGALLTITSQAAVTVGVSTIRRDVSLTSYTSNAASSTVSAATAGNSYTHGAGVYTWEYNIVADFNNNGISSEADDGYLTFTQVVTTSTGQVTGTSALGLNFQTGPTHEIVGYLDSSNLTGTVNFARFAATARANFSADTVTKTFFGADATTELGSSSAAGIIQLGSLDSWDSTAVFAGNLESFEYNVQTDGLSHSWDWAYSFSVETVADSVSVPEPTALALLGLGGLSLVTRRKR